MADLSFGQQLALSIASSLGTASIIGAAGFFVLRHQHKVRLEEEARGEVLKLRNQAFVDCVRALGVMIDARSKMIANPDASDNMLARLNRTNTDAGAAALGTVLANYFLLPPDLAKALLSALHAVSVAADVEAINAASGHLYERLRLYLPEVPRVTPKDGFEPSAAARQSGSRAPR